jgi:hypothetical protein
MAPGEKPDRAAIWRIDPSRSPCSPRTRSAASRISVRLTARWAARRRARGLGAAYDHDFVRENAALFEGNFIEPFYAPWEAEPQSPATQAYLTGIKAITNDPVELTEFGWIDAMEFVDGLKGAGPEFTQQKVIDYLNAQHAYSAQGLVPPIDWTTGHINPQNHPAVRLKAQCMPVLQIKGGKFVPFETPPGKPFTCLDASKGADQTPVYKSFAPGGVG